MKIYIMVIQNSMRNSTEIHNLGLQADGKAANEMAEQIWMARPNLAISSRWNYEIYTISDSGIINVRTGKEIEVGIMEVV